MSWANRIGTFALQLGLFAFGALLLAALVVTFLSLRSPQHVTLAEEKNLSGPGGHLMVSVIGVESHSARCEVTLRVRNNAAEDQIVRPSKLRYALVHEGQELPPSAVTLQSPGAVEGPSLGDRMSELLPEEEQRLRLTFNEGCDREDVLWVWWHDLITEWIPGGRRNVVTPKLTFAISVAD